MEEQPIPLQVYESTCPFPHKATAGGSSRLYRYPYFHLLHLIGGCTGAQYSVAHTTFYRFSIDKMGYIWYNRAINRLCLRKNRKADPGCRTSDEKCGSPDNPPGFAVLVGNSDCLRTSPVFPRTAPFRLSRPGGGGFVSHSFPYAFHIYPAHFTTPFFYIKPLAPNFPS